ncbi:MAG: hypothetical protein J1F10_06345, partial [Muribaculaceae bacterium]|nr:hypothetical protein [Muribaculaceae bacterium]
PDEIGFAGNYSVQGWINNKTGTFKDKITGEIRAVSEGCILIDITQWDKFIDIFKNKSDIVGIIINR